MPGLREKQITSKFVSALSGAGAWVYKIPDDTSRHGGQTQMRRFSLARPFDMIGMYQERGFAIEMKAHNSHGAFPLSSVQDHQLQSLRAFAEAGGSAFVAVTYAFQVPAKIPASIPQGLLDNYTVGRPGGVLVMFFEEIEYWDNLSNSMLAEGRASVPLDVLYGSLLSIGANNKSEMRWDVAPFLDYLLDK